jgi:enoyl-CoA hydratase/carnithine racemase
MRAGTVAFEEHGRVGVVTLNRPESKNAVNRRVAAELTDIRRQVGYGSNISVILLTGVGYEAFSIGTDKKESIGWADPEGDVDALRAAAVIGSFDRPVIAAVNGDAMGQGLEMMLSCDVRIASRNARFAMDQILKNQIPWDGGTQRLSRLVGRGKALEMILSGMTLDAEEALTIGLISQTAPPDEVLPMAMKMAEEMADKGPIALRYAKEAILRGMDMTLEQGFRLEADLYFLLHTTQDRTEGITAFREKRPPRFEGK